MDLLTSSRLYLKVISARAILEALLAYLDNVDLETGAEDVLLENVTCITEKALEDVLEAVRILDK